MDIILVQAQQAAATKKRARLMRKEQPSHISRWTEIIGRNYGAGIEEKRRRTWSYD